MKKVAAHDKWVCLDCRWTAKLPLLDVRSANRPSYRCPRCNQRMIWTGTAFRPPRKDDEQGWRVVEGLLAAGFRFRGTRQHQRVPRTLKELDLWLKASQEPECWLAERKVSLGTRVTQPVVRWGQQELAHRQRVLIWLDGDWREGLIILRGDGNALLPKPIVKLKMAGRSVPLTSRSRLRLPSGRPA